MVISEYEFQEFSDILPYIFDVPGSPRPGSACCLSQAAPGRSSFMFVISCHIVTGYCSITGFQLTTSVGHGSSVATLPSNTSFHKVDSQSLHPATATTSRSQPCKPMGPPIHRIYNLRPSNWTFLPHCLSQLLRDIVWNHALLWLMRCVNISLDPCPQATF